MRASRLAAVLVAAIVSACAIVMPEPDVGVSIRDLEVDPRPGRVEARGVRATGPVIEAARGTAAGEQFTVTVHASGEDVCIWVEREVSGGGGCGAMPGDGVSGTEPFGMIASGSGAGTLVDWSGIVPRVVASVAAETATGRAEAVLIPLDAADIHAQLFLVFVPADAEVRALVALADDGSVIGRFELGVAPVPRGPEPTPVMP